MNDQNTPLRKKEHLELCLTDKVAFRNKSNGLDHYEFSHNAITEVNFGAIDLSSVFLDKKTDYPFLISSMTGGFGESENINARLAEAANELNIPIGVGSQRQLLENDDNIKSYSVIRKSAPDIPVLANIGASQFSKFSGNDNLNKLTDLIRANALIIHINPLQELIQKKGQPDFSGLLKNIEYTAGRLNIPIIAKEVGSGISKNAARKLLEAGVAGIDVAGAGGTSWSAVEILRNNNDENDFLWDWGLPTSYCIRTVNKLKKKYNFLLVASGGIECGEDIAKSIALGADYTASARKILKALDSAGTSGVISIIKKWFDDVKKIMYLTGCSNIEELKNSKLIKKEELF